MAELSRAITRLNNLIADHREMKRQIAALEQQMRDSRGR